MKSYIIVESPVIYCNRLPEMYLIHNYWLCEKTNNLEFILF